MDLATVNREIFAALKFRGFYLLKNFALENFAVSDLQKYHKYTIILSSSWRQSNSRSHALLTKTKAVIRQVDTQATCLHIEVAIELSQAARNG
jgi:hypothetical protein